jgi:hypothetical protein
MYALLTIILLKVEGFLGITKHTLVFLQLRRKRQDERASNSFPTDYPKCGLEKTTN